MNVMLAILMAAQAGPPVTVKCRITGLYSPDRREDLNEAAKKMSGATLSEVDYDNGEVTFACDPALLPKNAKPEQILSHLDNQLRNASNHTFGLKPLCAVPRDKLQRVEIAVGSLDCKACAFGLYLAVSGVPGVEQAFANAKEGLVVAWLDPEKADRAKVVEALKKREIRVK
jgi:hypothetical protein